MSDRSEREKHDQLWEEAEKACPSDIDEFFKRHNLGAYGRLIWINAYMSGAYAVHDKMRPIINGMKEDLRKG